MIVAIGPVADLPSWNWVGIDAVKELSKYFHIELFNSFSVIPGASVIIVIKKLPPLSFIKAIENKKQRIIYMPIDYFESEEQIKMCNSMLRSCNLIISHSESLIHYFNRYTTCCLIEHSNKYALPHMNEFKQDGFILWIGGFQFVPYLIQWITNHPLQSKLVLCTDYNNKSAIGRAEELSHFMNIPLDKLHHFEMHEWSEEIQISLMKEAKAAIDIKGDNFSQRHKPPTKAQQFIISGIPFAINRDNNCHNYFNNRGFTICSPDDTNTWFSEEYASQTRNSGRQLRKVTSSEYIGRQLKTFVDAFINPTNPQNVFGFTVHRN